MYMSTCIRPGARAMLLTIGIYHLLKLTHRRLGPGAPGAGISQELNAEQENLQESLNELKNGLEKQPLGSLSLVVLEAIWG